MPEAPELVVFDFDGTLADTAASICGALAEAVSGGPVQRSAAAFHPWLGQPLERIHEQLQQQSPSWSMGYDEFLELYRVAERRLSETTVTLFDGVREVLERLDVPLAIASTKPTERLDQQVKALEIVGLFAHVQGTDGFAHKPAPEILHRIWRVVPAAPARTLFVGDAVTDIGAAQAAGAVGIGVWWGAHRPAQLMDAGAERVLERIEELLDVCAPRLR